MAQRRERIDYSNGSSRYIRRDPETGRFTDYQVDVSRSLSADNNQPANRPNTGGQGDRGDGRRRAKNGAPPMT